MSEIVVVGSINVDQVVVAKRRPKKGETIKGIKYTQSPGGKGANQAVAAARLGQKVSMIGAVGNDVMGEFSLAELLKNQVDIRLVNIIDHVSTGIAQITVAEEDNSIIIIPGANEWISPEWIDSLLEEITGAKLVILQHEIPFAIVEQVIEMCYKQGTRVILNPAPAEKLSKELIDKISYLTPNEHECKVVFDSEDTEALLRAYPNKLILTQGEKGVSFFDGNEIIQMPAYKNKVVDTTGAGDTFNGALAVGIIQGKSLKDAIDFANRAASLSITKLGAQAGMPRLEELQAFDRLLSDLDQLDQ